MPKYAGKAPSLKRNKGSVAAKRNRGQMGMKKSKGKSRSGFKRSRKARGY